MIEHVRELDKTTLEIETPVFPWQNVRKMGEDIVATELLFPRNHTVTPYCLGALIAGGVFSVSVRKRPRLAIIPTGPEIVDWRSAPLLDIKPGQVPESNAFVLGKLAEAAGGEYERMSPRPDDPAAIGAAVTEALESGFDMVLILGGSSAGSADYAREVVSRKGRVLVHGVTMMPGKPMLVGEVSNRPVFGVPGYPVSAILAFEQFIQPLIRRILQVPEVPRPTIEAVPTRNIPSKLGVEEFVRVKLGVVSGRCIATALPRGAGVITSMTEADGILRIPPESEGIPETEPVTIECLRPLTELENTVVVVGSHDNTLDVLADQLRVVHGRFTLSSSHVGSMGGLAAIRKNVCHAAGIHLLDTSDGRYNISYVNRYIKEVPVRLVRLVDREQGLMVPAGNPEGIGDIADLTRNDITFVNRQSGSGTRILLDYKLSGSGIDPADINGYENEEYTHMSVAAAVLGGAADAGLGIRAAARALQLDFIPVITEEYDLVLRADVFDTPPVQAMLDTIRSEAFQKRVMKLGGYGTDRTGELIF
jgi:putative molybdopterin biosynthesis protein